MKGKGNLLKDHMFSAAIGLSAPVGFAAAILPGSLPESRTVGGVFIFPVVSLLMVVAAGLVFGASARKFRFMSCVAGAAAGWIAASVFHIVALSYYL